jgi:4-carboxymuconolactone decarboxylase
VAEPSSDQPYEHLRARAEETAARVYGDDVSHANEGSPLGIGRLISYGDVWNRPCLSDRDRRLVTLTILVLEKMDTTIIKHARGALQAGDLVLDDLRELALHIAIYAGFPRASHFNGLLRQLEDEFGDR